MHLRFRTTKMDYQESVLVPYKIFEKCKFNDNLPVTTNNTQATITKPVANVSTFADDINEKSSIVKPKSVLNAENIPSDIKMNLYHKAKKLNLDNPNKIQNVIEHINDTNVKTESILNPVKVETYETIRKKADVQTFIRSVPEKVQPLIRSIIDRMLLFPNKVGWNDKFQLVLNQTTIENSNIIDIFNYLMKTPTSSETTPTGSDELHRFLIEELDIPESWIKTPLRRGRKRVKSEASTDLASSKVTSPSIKRQSTLDWSINEPPKVENKHEDIANFLRLVPDENQAIAKAIGQHILKYPSIISWNDNYELIDGTTPIKGSNMGELFRFLMQNKIVKKSRDLPIGGKEIYNILIKKLNVPRKWLKVILPEAVIVRWSSLQ